MFDSSGMMLMGAQSLLMLLFAVAALYFSWILSRAFPEAATSWFFRAVLAALVLKVVSFLAEQVPMVAIYVTGGDPLLWEFMTIIEVTLLFLETLAWLAAAGALVRWATVRKQRLAA